MSLRFTVHGSRKKQIQRIKYVLVLLWSIVYSQSSFSQDIHFTQFFTNPLIINPAHTGYFNGNYRFGFNFKAQWPWAIQGTVYTYHTESPYLDFSFGEKKLKYGWFGLGFHFLNDAAGDGRLTYQRVGGSFAYHQAFDKHHKYVLSAGAGVSFVVRSVNFSKFYFNNQWVEDMGFNTAVNSNEPVQRESFQMLDVNAGLHFGGQVHEQVKLDLGISMMHLNRPRHSFFNNNEQLGFRYQAEAGVKYQIDQQLSIVFNGYYGYQKAASELVLGSLFSYAILDKISENPAHTFYVGAYYRLKDALAPVVGYQYKQWRLLLSYDITLSKLLTASRSNGGPEISLVHTGSWQRQFNKKLYCPRF